MSNQPLPQVGIRREGPGGFFEQLSPSLGNRRFGRVFLPRCLSGGIQAASGSVATTRPETRAWTGTP